MQKPTIGRTVHYQSFGTPNEEYLSEPRASIITEVSEDGASLCILNPTGMFFAKNVPFSEEPRPGHWNWPPRV